MDAHPIPEVRHGELRKLAWDLIAEQMLAVQSWHIRERIASDDGSAIAARMRAGRAARVVS